MDSSGRRVQPSALHPSPGFHRRDLPPVVVAEVALDDRTRAWSGTAEFAVGTPEVRARIKGLLRWVPDASNPLTLPEHYWLLDPGGAHINLFGTTNLWLAKRDDVDHGGRGLMPVENLAGDRYAGLPIPEPGCLGWVFEAETTVPEIWGRFQIDASGGIGAGRWVLSAAADAVDPMTEGEWDRVCSRFYVKVQRGLLLSNGQVG